MSAFNHWLKQETNGDVAQAAQILFEIAANGSSDAIAWKYLKLTGDQTYRLETFMKAAKLALEDL